ncbi:MAG: hypothetical protein WBN68_02940 [Sedimenticolaceae bacterium]
MTENTGITRMRADAADESSMQQIREILFGEHRRLTAEHLARIESRVSEQDAALRRLLEERIGGAVQGLQEILASEGQRQRAALGDLDQTLRSLLLDLEQHLRKVDDGLQDNHDHLRQSLAARDEALDALQQQSVSRAQLADVLEMLARQLRT